jgi:hypothetical protein
MIDTFQQIQQKLGGRGKCSYCKEDYNNISYHESICQQLQLELKLRKLSTPSYILKDGKLEEIPDGKLDQYFNIRKNNE